jgi:hypothetical protein
LNGTRLGTGSSSKVLWGAQLVLGTSAGDYKATYAAAAAVGYTDIYGQPFAQKLVENTATGFHYALQQVTTVVGTSYVNTIYLKAAERSRARLGIVNSAGSVSYVINANLATGTFTASGAGSPTSTSASMTPVSGGWYRVSVAMAAPTAATQMVVYVQNDAGTTSYTGDGTSGIYIFGAQLSDSASVDPYVYQPVAAPTSTAYYGPRFDYDTSTATITKNYGPELVTNGDFSNGLTGWTNSSTGTGTATVLGGQLYLYRLDASNAGKVLQSIGSAQKTYRVSFTVVSGTAFVSLSGSGGNYSAGTYSFYWVPVGPSLFLENPANGTTCVLDNISVKEYLGTTATGATPKGLLIEEQRTNLCLYSESFQSGPWTQNNATDIANSTVAPNGTTTADTLVASVGTAAHTITSGALNPAAGIAASVYAKMGTASVIQLFIGGTATPYANFDLSVGTATAFGSGTAASITPVGNGWYRCVMTTTLTTATSLQIGIVPSTSSARAASWTATGTETVFIWGAQLEAGAFATSYIPTVASQVTRAADSASMIGNNFARWYNQTEGSFFASMDYMSATTTAWVLASHSGVAATTNDYLAFVKNSGAAHRQTIVASGASQGNLDVSGAVAGVVYKYAGCYKTNDAAFTVGGATPLTDSTVTLPVPNSLQVGNLFNQYLNGHIQRLAYYPRRLANSELQSITS